MSYVLIRCPHEQAWWLGDSVSFRNPIRAGGPTSAWAPMRPTPAGPSQPIVWPDRAGVSHPERPWHRRPLAAQRQLALDMMNKLNRKFQKAMHLMLMGMRGEGKGRVTGKGVEAILVPIVRKNEQHMYAMESRTPRIHEGNGP